MVHREHRHSGKLWRCQVCACESGRQGVLWGCGGVNLLGLPVITLLVFDTHCDLAAVGLPESVLSYSLTHVGWTRWHQGWRHKGPYANQGAPWMLSCFSDDRNAQLPSGPACANERRHNFETDCVEKQPLLALLIGCATNACLLLPLPRNTWPSIRLKKLESKRLGDRYLMVGCKERCRFVGKRCRVGKKGKGHCACTLCARTCSRALLLKRIAVVHNNRLRGHSGMQQ